MGLYSTNGAAPGSGMPSGARASVGSKRPSSVKNTGRVKPRWQSWQQAKPARRPVPSTNPTVGVTPNVNPQVNLFNPSTAIGIQSLWHGLQFGDGQSEGISQMQDRINSLQANNFGLYNTNMQAANRDYMQGLWDYNAQASASGMGSSGGLRTNHGIMKGVFDQNADAIDKQYGVRATTDLVQQMNMRRNQALMQILGLLSDSRDSLMPGGGQ